MPLKLLLIWNYAFIKLTDKTKYEKAKNKKTQRNYRLIHELNKLLTASNAVGLRHLKKQHHSKKKPT